MNFRFFLTSFILSSYHSFGTGIWFPFNKSATVKLSLFLILESCYHYFGGIIPSVANNIATVYPNLSYI